MTSSLPSGPFSSDRSSAMVFSPAPGLLASRRARMVALAGITGALELIEPRTLGPWQRFAYRSAVATANGLLMADVSRENESIIDPARDGVLAGAITFGAMDLTEKVDGKIVDALRGVGFARPRLLMAGVAAAATAATCALLPQRTEYYGWFASDALEPAEPVDLPENLYRLALRLLEAPEGGQELPGAAVLREQLKKARTTDVEYSGSDVELVVTNPEKLAVPHYQTWPVAGDFEREGILHRVELQITEGMLSMITVSIPDDPEANAADEGEAGDAGLGAIEIVDEAMERAIDELTSKDFQWPRAEEITLHAESDQPA